MIYNITDKLKFDEDPVLMIKDTAITVKSDAEVTLQLLDIINNNGEIAAAVQAEQLLFSAADRKKLKAMKLKTADWLEVISAATQMAFGEHPEEEPGEGQTRTTT